MSNRRHKHIRLSLFWAIAELVKGTWMAEFAGRRYWLHPTKGFRSERI